MTFAALRFALVAVPCVLLAGCSGLYPVTAPSSQLSTAFAGSVHGGQQPVTGASIQLYTVGTTASGSAPAPLLTLPAISGPGGSFTITGQYTCPSSTALVYITASGGNPGLGAGTNNTALTMMAALGQCGSLSASTFINIDEVTTVAAAFALSPFISAPFNIGSSPSDASALTAAFNSAATFADSATGVSPGAGQSADATSSSQGIPVATINTLANILASCVNTAGGTPADTSTPCGKLFSLTGNSTDTTSAVVALAKSPANYDTAALYALATPTAPFQPQLSSAPSNFNVSPTPPTGGSPLVRVIPTSGVAYQGSAIWVVSTTANCLYGFPTTVQINNTSYLTPGIQGCGRVYGLVPAGVPFGSVSGRVLSSSPGQTYNLNYPYYVTIVPRPDTSIAFTPSTLYWIGTAGTAGYQQQLTLANNTNATMNLGALRITGSQTTGFNIDSNQCGATLAAGGSCNITLSYSPAVTGLVETSLVISANNNVYTATAVLAGTGFN